jgi:transcriptional regulator with XRE-family HTH domain
VAKRRPVFHPALGEFFQSLRPEDWKQSDAARYAKLRGLKVLTRQVLLRLERGKTKWPSPAVLRAVADLYSLNYEELVHRVTEQAYGIPARPRRVASENDVTFVDVLADAIAAGPPLRIDPDRVEEVPVPFPSLWLRQRGITEPWCVRVGDQEQSMAGTISAGELVLLDCSDARRVEPVTDEIYAVNDDAGTGLFGGTLKRIIVVETAADDDRTDDAISRTFRQVFLVSDNPDKRTYGTRPLVLRPGELVQSRIVGQVMWHGDPV